MWPFTLKKSAYCLNWLSFWSDGQSCEATFFNVDKDLFNPTTYHVFGSPCFVLDSGLQSVIAGPPKWEPRSWLHIYVGHSPSHAGGMVQANVGRKVMLLTSSEGYFCTIFLHTLSSWCHKSIHINTNNLQTPPPWWWSWLPLQRCGFYESTPSEWWAALRIHFLSLLLKGLVKFNKLI